MDRSNANPDRIFVNVFTINKVLNRGINGSPVLARDNSVCGMIIGADTFEYENQKAYVISMNILKGL